VILDRLAGSVSDRRIWSDKLARVDDILVRRFRGLMKQHADACKVESARIRIALDGVFLKFLEARRTWAVKQRSSADDFNLFELMKVDGDEVNHSRLLAWLLDHRIEHGTHAQGSLGFRLFLEELANDLRLDTAPTCYADEPNYWVASEVSGDRARIDIEIGARNRFLIHIENKIYSAEGDRQTDREWLDFQGKADSLSIPQEARHAIFLTINGSKPMNVNFHPVAWYRIARVLDIFAQSCEAPEVELFTRHYAKAVRRLSVDDLHHGGTNGEV
jgi:hypothetical protein